MKKLFKKKTSVSEQVIIIISGVLVILGICLIILSFGKKEEPTEYKINQVENPVFTTEASKIVTKEVNKSTDQTTPVKSFYLEFIFEDNICVEAIYHTKYKVESNTENNLKEVLSLPNEYKNAYIDDDGYLVYSYMGDGMIGRPVKEVLAYLQSNQGFSIEEVYE